MDEVVEQPKEEGIVDLMQRMIDGNTLFFEEVPKVRLMRRPAPTPEGKIAVMLHAVHDVYFLVDKDPDCKDCGGDGLNKSKDAPRVTSEIPYCETCVHPELRHFGQIWEEKLAEQEQSAHAEVVDKKLEKRLADARARVAELIASKEAALGQNVLDVQATKNRIEEMAKNAHRFGELKDEHDRWLKDKNKEYADMEANARAIYEEKTREASAELAASLTIVKQYRSDCMAGYGKTVNKIAADYGANAGARAKAEEDLRRYEAGPAKIAKRWDEKIEPARKTLERLERQWKA